MSVRVSEPAISGENRAFVVPADVALGRPDPLSLPAAQQGVGTARAEEVTAPARLQFPPDRARIHPTPPHGIRFVTRIPACMQVMHHLLIGESAGLLDVRESGRLCAAAAGRRRNWV